MLFNTIVFLTFMGIVIPIFYFIKKATNKKYFLLFASYFFYGYWDWRFLGLLIFSSIMDFFLAQKIHATNDPSKKKNWLIISIILNLTILGFFKYFNFFVDSFQHVFGVELNSLHLNIILPVGISFYTFQSLSYTFDVYRGKMQSEQSMLDYLLFVAFFPQLVAGPIERAIDLLPQVKNLKNPGRKDIWEGILLISTGMFKKVLIGDTVARYVDQIFTEPIYYKSPELLSALLLFAIQIYADFSGYSNIARGSGKLLGVNLIINFKQPYISKNITDFWRRWHISLSSWLREYIYIWWLGGNRKGELKTYINLLVTMLIGGFWHGANYTFIIWGGIHGIALAVHKLFTKFTGESTFAHGNNFIKLISSLATFLIVVFAWLFFRSPDLSTAGFFLGSFINWQGSELATDFLIIVLSYYAATLIIDLIESKYGELFMLKLSLLNQLAILLPFWVIIIMYLFSIGKPMPFIYFQF
jgi:alginate O-acetyltransferase complex protein AlgI